MSEDKSLVESKVKSNISEVNGKSPSQILGELHHILDVKCKGKDVARVNTLMLVLDEITHIKDYMDRKREPKPNKNGEMEVPLVDLTNQSKKWLSLVEFFYDALNDLDQVKFEYEDLRDITNFILVAINEILRDNFSWTDEEWQRFRYLLSERGSQIDEYIRQVAAKKKGK